MTLFLRLCCVKHLSVRSRRYRNGRKLGKCKLTAVQIVCVMRSSISPLSTRCLPERSATLPLRTPQRPLADFQSLKQKLKKLMTSSGTVVSDRKSTLKDSKCKHSRSYMELLSFCHIIPLSKMVNEQTRKISVRIIFWHRKKGGFVVDEHGCLSRKPLAS